MPSASKKSTMASKDMNANPNYEGYIALFELFPKCQHISYSDDTLLIVNPEIRNIECVLSNALCPHCNKNDELLCLDELVNMDELLERIRGALREARRNSRNPWDGSDILARRWQLDIAYIEQIIWAFDDQIKDPSLPVVYNNHLHNLRQQAESRLQSLRQNKGIEEENYLSRRHQIHSEWAKMQGEHLGRIWVDMAKRKAEIPAVSLAPGDISITLPNGYELESFTNSKRIEGKLHYRVKYVGDPVLSEWQPLENFLDEDVLLYEYHKQHPRKPSPNEKDWNKARADVLWLK